MIKKTIRGVLVLFLLSIISVFGSCSDEDESNTAQLGLALAGLTGGETIQAVEFASLLGPENSEDAVKGTAPYFEEGLISAETLADEATYPNQITLSNVSILGSDGAVKRKGTFKGVLLKDVLITGAAFRPDDKGKDGRASVVIARGDSTAVFSFWELIKSNIGQSAIVAYEMDGNPLPASLGDLALVSAVDNRSMTRFVTRLSEIEVVNEWIDQNDDGSSTSSFSLSGGVETDISISADSVSDLTEYNFYDVGPSFRKTYWKGAGVRLADVLDKAGLTYPDEKNRCYVLLEAADDYRNTFSCGELFFTDSGIGTSTAAAAVDARSRGILVVTGSFAKADGTTSSDCTTTVDNCHVDGSSTWEDDDGDMMTIVSTEDNLPFGWPEDDSSVINLGGRHISWITSATVKYVE